MESAAVIRIFRITGCRIVWFPNCRSKGEHTLRPLSQNSTTVEPKFFFAGKIP